MSYFYFIIIVIFLMYFHFNFTFYWTLSNWFFSHSHSLSKAMIIDFSHSHSLDNQKVATVFNLSLLVDGDQLISINQCDKQFLANFGSVSLSILIFVLSCSFFGFSFQFLLSLWILFLDFLLYKESELFSTLILFFLWYPFSSHSLFCFQFYFHISVLIYLLDFFYNFLAQVF